MLGNKLINTNAGGGCTNTVDLYNPFPDGGGVALYQLNGDATDVSGNYDGTASNVTYGAGEFGQAGVFNGSSSLISAPNNSLLTQTEFSVSAWVNHNSATGYRVIISNYGYTAANGESGWIIALNAGKVRVFNVVSGASYFVDSIASIPGGVFTNVAVTNTQSQVNIYINGSLDSTHSMSGFVFNLAINNYLTIGAYKYDATGSPNGKFDGSIDQVRIFSRALRPYEVEALYTEEYCTPTIVPSEHFNTVTYSGQATDKQVTGVGFQPDLTWVKCRDVVNSHVLSDSVRGGNGTTLYFLSSNLTNADSSSNQIQSLDLDGFTVWGDRSATNRLNQDYVAWNFKAGGAAVTNTDGTITSQVSANTEAGFSIITTTTNGSGYLNCGHGLGVKPDVVLIKSRDNASTWYMYHKGTSATPQDDAMQLNSTSAVWNAGTYGANKWSLSDTVIASGTAQWYYQLNSSFVIYSFAEVEGFSNFGSYVGTGTSNGNFVVTGFEPAFVMVKRTDASGNSWLMVDNKRIGTGNEKHELFANTTTAESGGGYDVAFLENGFQMQTTTSNANASGGSYIYMAFAADPTTIEPSLEDSFNTVLYTGNGSTQSVTGVGFQPDFTWIKARSFTQSHRILDSVRPLGSALLANSTAAEGYYNEFSSFDNDGFTVKFVTNQGTNASGQNYVAWNWKGAELPAINSNGSIPSVVSANPAAGFSIVSWTSNYSGNVNESVGHGLNQTPDLYIVKKRNNTSQWYVYAQDAIGNNTILLNEQQSATSSGWISAPTETTFNAWDWSSGSEMITYCFHSVSSFSKIGSYDGIASGDITINCGFEPAFVIIKGTTGTNQNWIALDNKRSPNANAVGTVAKRLNLEASTAETDWNPTPVVFTATGFYTDSSVTLNNYNDIDRNGESYMYMAFANQF